MSTKGLQVKKFAMFVAVMVLLSGCAASSQDDSAREVRRGETATNLRPATIEEPDSIEIYLNVEGFRNVSRMCIDGNGIYVTSRGGLNVNTDGQISGSSTGGSLPSSIAVVPNDEGCQA